MCGIFIAIHKNQNDLHKKRAAYSRALSELSFRGPDLKIEKIIGNNIFFGQTILSLTGDVENSKGEHLFSRSKKYQIAFNGEIYNYKELYKNHLPTLHLKDDLNELSDTEVLVNLHDVIKAESVPQFLDGMYAYTLFDFQNERLIINRDPQGEKTLYIFENSEVIYISSEIRAITTLQSFEIDEQVLRDYFSTRHFMFNERTLYKGIRQLAPGHAQALDLSTFNWKTLNKLNLSSFINPEKYEQNNKRSLEDLTDELDVLLGDAIREMIPFGRQFASVVSGGVDSSLISSYAVKYGDPKILIAVNHLGKDLLSKDLDGFEKYFKRPITILNVDKVVYSQNLTNCQRILSAPVYSHSFVGQALQSQYVRGEGCIAMFGGEGADELFGGYSAYLDKNRRNLDSPFSLSPYSGLNQTAQFKNNHPGFLQEELAQIWKDAKDQFDHISDLSERAAHAMMFCDLAYQLPAVGLRGADQMSMMWSVETRSVFIRRKLIEFGLNLPMKYKSDINEVDSVMSSKKILKNLFIRHFGKELLLPKQGFSGFPNESGVYLGPMENYLSPSILGELENSQPISELSREGQWKFINVEYFLRTRR
jgi:asparagine synthase (glutamine-hydrolysing)